ncbi:hypothetical protein B0H14DRAFT_2634277 [Mycena olivaceomarginata]|nr:hypothetical protein B0H14DRAFT_2634277 [Mycena olivaceomarginata]
MYLAVEYWRGIASSTRFPGFKLEKCLNTLHIDIVTSWNFNDPDKLFVIVLALGPPNLLSQTEIEAALHKYTSGAADGIHTEIREYCNEATFAKIYRSSKAEEKITELIGNHHVKWEKAEPTV